MSSPSPSYILLGPEDLQVLAEEELARLGRQGSRVTVTMDPAAALAVGAILSVCCVPPDDPEDVNEDLGDACRAARLMVDTVREYFHRESAWATLEMLRRYVS